MPLSEQLLELLGKEANEVEVLGTIKRYGFYDVYDDPPFRHYVGSAEKGVDLLFEHNHLIAIQIYVQSSTSHSAFNEELPFQIKAGMTDQQIHALLGEPDVLDDVGSRYTVLAGKAKLSIVYDRSKVVSYLNIGRGV